MRNIVSVPHLFATASNLECVGSHRCFYCLALCDEHFPASEYVKDSFTGRNEVPAPGSRFICQGCVLCLREDAHIPMLNGTTRHVTKCAMRAWSWLVTSTAVKAGSKADLKQWRALCLEPPEPPYAIVLSDSGQKHLLYRGVVCWSRESVVVTLEGERVEYSPAELRQRMDLVGRVCASSGKPALTEPPTVGLSISILSRYRDGEAIIDQWGSVWNSPLSRLAAWLCPNSEESKLEWPSDLEPAQLSGVPAKTGKSGGSRKKDRPDNSGGGQAGSNPTLFDFC